MSTTGNNKERILQSLGGLIKVPAPDFFYTRLKARMERESGIEKPVFFLLRPAFLIGCMVFVFMLNIIALTGKQQQPATNNSAAGNIESFAKEYNLSGTSQLYE